MCNLYFAQQEQEHGRDHVSRAAQPHRPHRSAAGHLSQLHSTGRAPCRRRRARDGAHELGLSLLQAGKAPRRVTNVRDDKILTSSFWRSSFEQRRCLVPATSFCEPNGDVKPATWHWFALKGDDPRPLFAFAGVWRRYKGPIKKDGPSVELEVYSFLTTTPNPLVETINHERMPVLLTTEDEFATWLNGTPTEAMTLARQYPPECMRIVQEGFTSKTCLRRPELSPIRHVPGVGYPQPTR